MTIKINSIALKNFKGFKSAAFDFTDKTKISGRNASGKTTIFDGFMWLLFNKDSSGNEKFKIRPLDKDGSQIDNIEISVSATLDIDGRKVQLSKSQKQNWVKKRGTQDAVLQGNVNSYEIDGYPKTEKEYKAYISGILSEDSFKMLTSPTYFPNLAWKDQRAIIMRFAEDVSDVELAGKSEEFAGLIEELKKAPSTDDIQKKYQKALTEWKKKQAEIPVRIDELSAQKTNIDFAELELYKNGLLEGIEENRKKQEDVSRQYEDYQKIIEEIEMLKSNLSGMKVKAREKDNKEREAVRDKISGEKFLLIKTENTIKETKFEISLKQNSVDELEKNLKKLKDEYSEKKSLEFDGKSLVCPYCGQEFQKEKKDAIMAEFEGSKAKELSSIEQKETVAKQTMQKAEYDIMQLKEELKSHEESREMLSISISKMEEELSAMKENGTDVSTTEEYKFIQNKIDELTEKKEKYNINLIRQQLMDEQEALNRKLNEVEKDIAKSDQNVRIDGRISELQEEQRETSQKVADQEKMLYLLEKFIRYKMDKISENINRMFDGVSFRLFETQINGGTKETCECMFDGVPYASLNSGHKIVAGMKIIKALQGLYGVYAPVFIDNAESVNECNMPDMRCQTISLFVDEDELRIESVS